MSAVSRAFEPCFRLPLSFDQAQLRQDLEALEGFEWVPEAPFLMKTPFVTKTQTYHDGKWKGLALRSQGGSYTCTDPGGPGLEPITDSDALARTPYFQEVMNSLPCDKRTVRLLSLPSGAEVGTHVDPYHGFKFGQIRLHCPIVTHPDVKMLFESQPYHWPAGELWYADFGRPHAVQNKSSITRIHMVIDALITPELLSLFPPEFVDQQHRSGILMQERPVPAEQGQLRRYTCDFSLPGALIQGLLETDDGSVPGELDGSVRIEGARLALCIEGTPLFGLDPIGEHRFTLTGWTPERLVIFETDTDGRPEAIIFRLRAGKNESAIRIPVQAPTMAH